MHLIPTMNNARDTPLATRARSDAAPLRAKLGVLARAGPGHVAPLLRAKPATSAPAGRATRAGPGHAVPPLRPNFDGPAENKKKSKKIQIHGPDHDPSDGTKCRHLSRGHPTGRSRHCARTTEDRRPMHSQRGGHARTHAGTARKGRGCLGCDGLNHIRPHKGATSSPHARLGC